MILNGLFDTLGFNTYISLCGACAAVLKESLYQSDVIAIGVIDLSGVPLAKAVCADTGKSQVVADDCQLLLYCPLCNGEDNITAPNPVSQTVVFNVLLDYKGNGKDSAFAGLLLHYLQPVTITVFDYIAEPKLQNVTDPQAQVALQHQDGGDSFVGSATAKTLF